MINRKAQAGLSLIELFIASSTGILLLVSLIQILQGVTLTYGATNQQMELNNNGQAAINLMATLISHAGYWEDNQHIKTFAEESGFKLNTMIIGTDDYQDTTGTGTDIIIGSDSITMRLTGVTASMQSSVPLCKEQFQLTEQDIAIQKIYVKNNNNIPTLMCDLAVYKINKATGKIIDPSSPIVNTSVELIEQIDTLQILYTVDMNKHQTSWRRADQIGDWNDVSAIKIGILTGTNDRQYGSAPPKSYSILDESFNVTNEKTPKKVFESTIFMRNSIKTYY